MELKNRNVNTEEVLLAGKEDEFVREYTDYIYKEYNYKKYTKEDIKKRFIEEFFNLTLNDIIGMIKDLEEYTNKKFLNKIKTKNDKRRLKALVIMNDTFGFIPDEEDLIKWSKKDINSFKLFMSVIDPQWFYRNRDKGAW